MATRKQLAERALRILQGGEVSKDTDIDLREVMLHIDSERDSIIQMKLIEGYKSINKRSTASIAAHEVLGSYVSEYTLKTAFDSNRNQRYGKLPVMPLDLPDEAGILSVRDAGDFSTSYSRISIGLEAIYLDLPSLAASNKGYYIMRGDRIYFDDSNPPTNAWVSLVALSSGIGDDDLYPLSPGDESIIIKSVVELYTIMSTAAQDVINNNIDE